MDDLQVSGTSRRCVQALAMSFSAVRQRISNDLWLVTPEVSWPYILVAIERRGHELDGLWYGAVMDSERQNDVHGLLLRLTM